MPPTRIPLSTDCRKTAIRAPPTDAAASVRDVRPRAPAEGRRERTEETARSSTFPRTGALRGRRETPRCRTRRGDGVAAAPSHAAYRFRPRLPPAGEGVDRLLL